MNDEDNERMEFLERLARSHAYLTEWEANFLDSRLEHGIVSESQRQKIDEMRKRYEREL